MRVQDRIRVERANDIYKCIAKLLRLAISSGAVVTVEIPREATCGKLPAIFKYSAVTALFMKCRFSNACGEVTAIRGPVGTLGDRL